MAELDGTLATDSVSLLSIAKPEAHGRDFIALTTSGGKNLTLTPEHHLPIGETCCSTLKKAKDVRLNDKVWTVASGAATAETVTMMKKVADNGLHSPVPANGGLPVVNGIVTSFDRIESVKLAKAGLAYMLSACKATGTCELVRDSLFNY